MPDLRKPQNPHQGPNPFYPEIKDPFYPGAKQPSPEPPVGPQKVRLAPVGHPMIWYLVGLTLIVSFISLIAYWPHSR
jgi:hypothetical protein